MMKLPALRKSEEFKTYLLNGAQVLSMSTMAFGVPAVIGIEEYGRFAALFALPGTLTVFIQGLYVSRVGACVYEEFRVGALLFNILISVLAFSIVACFQGAVAAFIVAFIFVVLLERFRWDALTLMLPNNRYKEALRNSEIFTFIISVVLLVIAQLCGVRSYLLPIALLGVGMSISIWNLAATNPKYHCPASWRTCLRSVLSGSFSGVFVRLHEELFIVQMPYTLSLVLGHWHAGVFRVTVSVAKLFFKAFPYRYETVMSDFVEAPPDTTKILRYFVFVNVLSAGFAAAIVALKTIFPDASTFETVDVWILGSAGFLAMASIFSPLLVLYQPRYYLLIVVAFALNLFVLICYGYLWFQVAFLFVQLAMFVAIVKFLLESGARHQALVHRTGCKNDLKMSVEG